MNASEAVAVLTAAATVDKRTIGEADARMWAEILPESIGPKLAIEGVKHYYATNREMIMPVDVVEHAKFVRDSYRGRTTIDTSDDHHALIDAHRIVEYNREFGELIASRMNPNDAHRQAVERVLPAAISATKSKELVA